MAQRVVSAATGALNVLLEKLAALLGDEYKRFSGVGGKIKSLAAELEAMNAFLLKMSEEDDPDVQDKIWTKEVRELSYDMEDSLDEFMLHVDEKSANPDGFINKCKNKLTEFKTRYKIGKVIEDLKIQVDEVAKRNARYKTRDETIMNERNRRVDPRALAIFEDASKLVGIDGPKHELIEALNIKECETSGQVKVMSIVGIAGLGKTTLANQVYQQLMVQFDCGAFVSVSRTPDMMKILRTILSEISRQPYANTEAGSIQQLIGQIRDYLEDKRYLIVIDDIWNQATWTPIKHALLNNSKHSRIITTTRILQVAEACRSSVGVLVYRMGPLSRTDSEKMFFERIFGSRDDCPAYLTDVSNKIIEKCGGLPLAIISISGILANRPQTVHHWDQVQNAIGRALGKNPDAQGMMQILSLSYFDLPHHLKTCLLYLCVFPEDYRIEKPRLVRRWIAEGFIREEQGHTQYELGEVCFNELINRSLIHAQALDIFGEVTACQVHDVIRDFILLKSEEENFVTIFDDYYKKSCAQSRVRRLSLQAKSQENIPFMEDMRLSHIRSVTVFDNSMELYSWSKFHFLRVLDLQGCRKMEDHHLADIGNLFLLKYLGLCGTGVCELPEQISKLQYLETLDLKWTKVTKLPVSIAQLRKLIYLAVGVEVQLPDGIGSMIMLEDLVCVNIFKQSIDFTRELGQLKNLRNVMFFLRSDSFWTNAERSNYKEHMSNIASSLCKLGQLNSLSIDIDPKCKEDFCLDSGGGAPCGLRRFDVMGNFISKVPNWVGSLINLQLLSLYVMEFEAEDVLALGRLPALVSLRLITPETFPGRRVRVSGTDGFQCLQYFDYRSAIPIIFEAGAMPKLKMLKFMFSVVKTVSLISNQDFHFGIQHLSSLDSASCALCFHWNSIVDRIAEKETQIADISCELAEALVAELVTTTENEWGQVDDMKSALRAHLSSAKLELVEVPAWWIEQEVVDNNRQLFFCRHAFGTNCRYIAGYRLRFLKTEVEARIRNCPLKGQGNCTCRRFPEVELFE
ncbi:hypothetical protein ACP70R_015905 [Stipagrostis hirtigluma subsp. patula]